MYEQVCTHFKMDPAKGVDWNACMTLYNTANPDAAIIWNRKNLFISPKRPTFEVYTTYDFDSGDIKTDGDQKQIENDGDDEKEKLNTIQLVELQHSFNEFSP